MLVQLRTQMFFFFKKSLPLSIKISHVNISEDYMKVTLIKVRGKQKAPNKC